QRRTIRRRAGEPDLSAGGDLGRAGKADRAVRRTADSSGEHAPEVFRRTTGLRADHHRSAGVRAPLLGKLFDETGDGLTPTRTSMQGRSYRYYVSNRLITAGSDLSGLRLPAIPLEQEVARQIVNHLRHAAERHRLLQEVDARAALILKDKALALPFAIEREPQVMLPTMVNRGDIAAGTLTLRLDAAAIATHLVVQPATLDPKLLQVAFTFSLRRRGIETKLIVGDCAPEPDLALLRALADAHKEMARRRAGHRRSDIDGAGGAAGSRMRRRSYLAFLSPRIQQATLAGQVPEGVSPERMLRTDLTLDRSEQEKCLGFDSLFR
ncbi:hypothetical protein LHP98_18145, partial [Rhodobacter sp. Har01]|nr:hypothetical protein [Rhodobacter sp. Har01]